MSSHKYSFYFGHLKQIRAQIRRWSCHKSADDLGTNPQKIRAQIRGRSLAPITVCFTGIFMRSVRASSAVGRGCPGPGWNPRRTPPGTSGGRTRRICPPGGGLVSLHLLAPLVEDPWWANNTFQNPPLSTSLQSKLRIFKWQNYQHFSFLALDQQFKQASISTFEQEPRSFEELYRQVPFQWRPNC